MIAILGLAWALQAPLGPIVPAGANRSFHEAVLNVEDALEKGQFDVAEKAMRALPKRKFTIRWDDSKVPESLRESYARARDQAISRWTTGVSDMTPEFVKTGGDLVVSFAPSLPDNADGFPAGAAQVFSTSPSDPRLEDVISLSRGRPAQPTTANEVHNEVLYAIAAYVGLERTPFSTAASFRNDQPGAGQISIGQTDAFGWRRLFDVVDKLAEAIHKKAKLTAARPRLQYDTAKIVLPNAVQGEPVKFTIAVTNAGNAPVNFRFQPDCGCLNPTYSPILDPGRTGMVTVFIDTVQFVGELRHKFYVYANDADFPMRELPVQIDVAPLYRLIRTGPSVQQFRENGFQTDVYLALAEQAKFKVLDSRLDGLKGEVTMTPFEGEVETERGKPKEKIKGFKYHIDFEPSPLSGRLLATLSIKTDSEILPVLRHNIMAQHGIVALPESLYMGEIPHGVSFATMLVSRPDLPFKIQKIESDSPYLTAKAVAQSTGDEYRVSVRYDGRGDYGKFQANLTIFTDDPKQPQLVVPVSALIR